MAQLLLCGDAGNKLAHDTADYVQRHIAELAKAEILKNFSQEPEPYEWTEQDILEQSRKILIKWSRN